MNRRYTFCWWLFFAVFLLLTKTVTGAAFHDLAIFSGNSLAGISKAPQNLIYNPAKIAHIKETDPDSGEGRQSQLHLSLIPSLTSVMMFDIQSLQNKQTANVVDSANILGGVAITSLFHSNWHLAIGFGQSEANFWQKISIQNSPLDTSQFPAPIDNGNASVEIGQKPLAEPEFALAYSRSKQHHFGVGVKYRELESDTRFDFSFKAGDTLITSLERTIDEKSWGYQISFGYKQSNVDSEYFVGMVALGWQYKKQNFTTKSLGLLPQYDAGRSTFSTLFDRSAILLAASHLVLPRLKVFSEAAVILPMKNQFDEFLFFHNENTNQAHYNKMHVTLRDELSLRVSLGYSLQVGHILQLHGGATLRTENSESEATENFEEALLNVFNQKVVNKIFKLTGGYAWQVQSGISLALGDYTRLFLGATLSKFEKKQRINEYIAINEKSDYKEEILKIISAQAILGLELLW